MASVKIGWRSSVGGNGGKNAIDYEKYVLKKATNVEFNGLTPGSAAQSIIDSPAFQSGRSKNVFFEVIQSFSHDESEKLGASKITDFGTDFVKKAYPNHDFLLVTHADTKHIHNHILISPINNKTLKRDIYNKKELLSYSRGKSNELSKEWNLSIIEETREQRQAKLHPNAKEILKRGGVSYQLDMMQKADLARSLATSFDEYVSYMSEFGIKVGVENKNIKYLYPTKSKNIRGNKLGAAYDKEKLIESFKENDRKFKSIPFLKEKMRDEFGRIKNGRGDLVGTPSDLFSERRTHEKALEKDYDAFTKSYRDHDPYVVPSKFKQLDPILPFNEIERANKMNLIEYCRSNKIELVTNKKGQQTIIGRPFVVISENGYLNVKNKTKGQYLDFVALHKETTYLRALSEITGNKNLLLLENHLGKVKRPFNSFYIPKDKRMGRDQALKQLKSFFTGVEIRNSRLEQMLNKEVAQVGLNGSIRFFNKGDNENAYEFNEGANGDWSGRKVDPRKPASIALPSVGKKAVVIEGIEMITQSKKKLTDLFKEFDHIIFSDGKDRKSVEVFIGNQKNIKEVTLLTKDKGSDLSKFGLEMFKDNLSKSGISFSLNNIGPHKSRSRINFDLNI